MAKKKTEKPAEPVVVTGAEQAQDGAEQAQGGPNQPAEVEVAEPVNEAAPAPVAEPEDDVDWEAQAAATATLVPMDNGKTECPPGAKELLLEACERFGVDPTVERQPSELGSWNFYKGDRRLGVPASVVLVTAGGVKLRHYADPDYVAPNCTEPAMDQDTEDTLARLFGAYRKDAQKNLVRMPLPEDLALPGPAVTGFPTQEDHRYRRGYLAEGGKAEADRRDAALKAKKKKR